VRNVTGPCQEVRTRLPGLYDSLRVMNTDSSAAPLSTLLENHRAFLRYLERRVGDRTLAEDILQNAFAKIVTRPEQAAPTKRLRVSLKLTRHLVLTRRWRFARVSRAWLRR
jgi:DNA-directed RNA polymerase specialized sigma24 family protein